MNENEHLAKNERLHRHELKIIYANPDDNGIWVDYNEIITIINREHHVDCLLIDETAFERTDFVPFMVEIRKKTNDKIRILPITSDENLVQQLVQKQFNQFFKLEHEKNEEEQAFALDGLLTNPRTASDVEAFMVQNEKEKNVEPVTIEKIKVETKFVENVRIETQLTKQQRIALLNVYAGAGSSTIAIEMNAFLQKQKKKTLLVTFDNKLAERYSDTVAFRNEEIFLREELELLQSDYEYIIYDLSTLNHDFMDTFGKFFSQTYYVFDFNYPKLLEHTDVFTNLKNQKGTFLINKHGNIPVIDKSFRQVLQFSTDTQIETFPNIDRNDILFAEINHQASGDEKVQEQLGKLLNLTISTGNSGFISKITNYFKA